MPNSKQSNRNNAVSPQLLLGQLGGNALSSGDIVNLFRGNLSFPLEVLSLPGRNGLDCTVNLLYQSNVQYSIDNWNLESPADIVGFGWSLPFDRIVISNKNNGSTLDDEYYLVNQGQLQRLIPIPTTWSIGQISSSSLEKLMQGSISAEVQKEWKRFNQSLSQKIRLEKLDDMSYILRDDEYERAFVLHSIGSNLYEFTPAAQSFELEHFQYWQISYYKEYEKWEIVKNDGTIYTYGGNNTAAAANTLQYGVKWNNWVGPTDQINGTQYITAWNLAQVTNVYGNYYTIQYDVVNRSIGERSGNLFYTKECNIGKITNDFGWTLLYAYLPKIYDTASLDAPKEYLDPHKDPTLDPATTPDLFQSCYGTRYLNTITLQNADQETLTYIQFKYYDLQNLTARDEKNLLTYGATYKRYLKSVEQYFQNGEMKPPINFIYNFTTDTAQNRGALIQILQPAGAINTIHYQEITVGADDNDDPGARNVTIANPFGENKEGVPRIWYGNDYIVSAWYSTDENMLKLNIFTWMGTWYKNNSEWFTFDKAIVDIDNTQIAASSNTFLLAISYQDKTSEIFLFNRRSLCNGNWDIYRENGAYKSYHYGTDVLNISNGENFFIANGVDTDSEKTIDRYAWNWSSQNWDVHNLSVDAQLCQTSASSSSEYYTTAYDNYYIILCHDQTQSPVVNKFSIYYRSPVLQEDSTIDWRLGSSFETDQVNIPKCGSFSYCSFSPSNSFAAMAYITRYTVSGLSFSRFDYELQILTWDEEFNHLTFAEITDIDADNFKNIPSPIINALGPQSVENTLVGAGPNTVYYDGNNWRYKGAGIKFNSNFSDPSLQYYWYTYTSCSILKTENTDSGIYSELIFRNLNDADAGWQSIVLEDNSSTAGSNVRSIQAYPSQNDTYLTVGTKIYNRSVYSNWADPENPSKINENYLLVDFSTLDVLKGLNIDTTTMINQAPYFIAFMTVDATGKPTATYIVFLRNGDVVRDAQGIPVIEKLEGQRVTTLLNKQYRYQDSLNGKLPAIPLGLVTYSTEEEISASKRIVLHRYVDESMHDPISAFVVNDIQVDNGYDILSKCYEYTDVTAAQDATGTVVRFQTVTEYSGCQTPKEQVNGYTTSYFYNGLPPATSESLMRLGSEEAHQSYTMLDGMHLSKEMYTSSGALVSSVVSKYKVTKQIATDAEGSSLRTLYGGIVLLDTTVSMLDGITTTTEITYSPSSGNPVMSTSSYYGSTGELITNQTITTYAYEKYAGMWQQNLLNAPAQTVNQAKTESQIDYEILSINVQTYKQWEIGVSIYWADSTKYKAVKADAAPFILWNEGNPPDDSWLKTEAILQRNTQGGVTESADVDGMITTTIFDDIKLFALAQVVNASLGQNGIGYDSFEDYQQTDWNFSNSGGSVINTDSFTGNNCFNITSTGTFTKNITMTELDRTYILGCWLKITEGAVVSMKLIDTASKAASKRIVVTKEKWCYEQWVVNPQEVGMSGNSFQLAIDVTISETNGYVRIDDIFWVPLEASFQADVYNRKLLRHESTISPNGVCQRSFYDLFFNAVGQTGVYENPLGFTTNFLTRQTTDMTHDAAFPKNSPNFSVNIEGQGQGFYDEFKEGTLENYSFINSIQDDWQVSNHQLVFTGASSAPLGAQLQRNDFQPDNHAVYMIFDTDSSNTVSLGTGTIFVVWNGDRWQLMGNSGGSLSCLREVKDVEFQREWMFIVFDSRVLFFANGILIFNYQADGLTENKVQIGMQKSGKCSTLLVAEDISLSLSYKDGTGKELQTIAMESGSSVILQAMLYDSLGRNAITVAPSRITTATVTNPFSYYPNYITNGGCTGSLWNGSAIEGDVNTFHADAEGYPFSRQVYEAAPTQRVIRMGQPGKEFAITAEGNTHITTIEYGSNQNDPGFFYQLPIGKYFTTTSTDPDGNMTISYMDALQKGQQEKARQSGEDTPTTYIGVIQMSSSSDAVIKYSYVYNTKGQMVISLPPLYYENLTASPDTSTVPPEASTSTYDFFGRQIVSSVPDSGKSRYMYNNRDQIRFYQDASSIAQGYLNFMKYDILGRNIEKGSYQFDWNDDNQVTLQNYANNTPAWPDAPTTWASKFRYDGDGSTDNMVGNLWQSFANNHEKSDGDVFEIYAYDRLGNVIRYELVVTDYRSESQFIEYTYNPGGAQISSTDSLTLLKVENTYNPLGQLIKVMGKGSDNIESELVNYAYNQEGNIEKMVIMPVSGTTTLSRQYEYLPIGWMKTISDPTLDETLGYTEGSCDNQGYYTGAIANQKVQYKQGHQLTDAYCFKIDYLNRIATANNSTTANSWEMDGNSNFINHKINSVTRSYVTKSTANQLESVMADDASFARNYFYTEAGEVKTIKDKDQTLMQIEYHKDNGLPRNIGLPRNTTSDTLLFAYGPGNQRVLKTAILSNQTVAQRLYIDGLSDVPTVEIDHKDGTTQIKRYISLPGTTIIFYNNRYYFALKDHLGSTRTIIDQANTVVGQYNYDVYGAPTLIQTPDFSYDYLYTGQEYDAESQLYNYKARLYDPEIGRFIMIDPAMQYFSPYVYAGNNPLIFIDPSGEFSWAAFGAIIGGIAAIAGGVALTVLTFGATTPVLVGCTIAGGALIGAGMSSALYGATHIKGNFSAKEFGIMVGLGAGFGAVSAGIGLGIGAAGLSTMASIGADAATGAGLGALDGYVTNGALTGTWTGSSAAAAAGWGALFGGVAGGIGGGARAYIRPRGSLNNPNLETDLQNAIRNPGANGYARLNSVMNCVPRGTRNTFSAGRGLKRGFKYDFLGNQNRKWIVRGHEASRSVNAGPNSRSGWTLEVEAPPASGQRGMPRRRLSQFGNYLDAGRRSGVEQFNEVHIPLGFFF